MFWFYEIDESWTVSSKNDWRLIAGSSTGSTDFRGATFHLLLVGAGYSGASCSGSANSGFLPFAGVFCFAFIYATISLTDTFWALSAYAWRTSSGRSRTYSLASSRSSEISMTSRCLSATCRAIRFFPAFLASWACLERAACCCWGSFLTRGLFTRLDYTCGLLALLTATGLCFGNEDFFGAGDCFGFSSAFNF